MQDVPFCDFLLLHVTFLRFIVVLIHFHCWIDFHVSFSFPLLLDIWVVFSIIFKLKRKGRYFIQQRHPRSDIFWMFLSLSFRKDECSLNCLIKKDIFLWTYYWFIFFLSFLKFTPLSQQVAFSFSFCLHIVKYCSPDWDPWGYNLTQTLCLTHEETCIVSCSSF